MINMISFTLLRAIFFWDGEEQERRTGNEIDSQERRNDCLRLDSNKLHINNLRCWSYNLSEAKILIFLNKLFYYQ